VNDTTASDCTCPSGDGSLRHPCPTHPIQRAQAQPAAAQEAVAIDDMDLPPGKTCGDCAHCRRCTMIFGHIPEDESCDWSPSRFNEKQPTSHGAGVSE